MTITGSRPTHWNRSLPLATASIAGVLYLAATLLAMHAIQPGLNPATHFLSEYAHGQLGWLVQVGYVVAGTGVLALAWRVFSALSGRWALASAACLAIVGVGVIATGLTRLDVANADGVIVSTASGQAHVLAGYVELLGMLPGAFLVSAAFRRDPRLAGAAGAARLFAWALLAAFVVSLVLGQAFPGIGQRILVVTVWSWLIFVGLHLRFGEPLTTGHVPAAQPIR
jgi:hypothetical protein